MQLKCKKGSLTAEAALLMPIVLSAFFFFLFLLQIITAELRLEGVAVSALDNAASCGYLQKDIATRSAMKLEHSEFADYAEDLGELLNDVAGNLWFNAVIGEKIRSDHVLQHVISGGASGISFWGSNLYAEDEMTVIHISYQIEFPVFSSVLPKIKKEKQWMMRSFSGEGELAIISVQEENGEKEEEAKEEESGEYVYVAKTGTVYHVDRTCSYIRPEVEQCDGGAIWTVRNESGAKYYDCEACCAGETAVSGKVYWIAKNGTRYHSNKNCSKITRTVTKILLSKAEGYRPCSKCAAKK